jgi:hypothetical protein
MSAALVKLGLYLSVLAAAALAMRPKLSLALLVTIPTALMLAEAWTPFGIHYVCWIVGILASGVCLSAVILAVFFRRAGDIGARSGSFEALTDREIRYSSSDRFGLWLSLAILCVAILGTIGVALHPPMDSHAVRVGAIIAAPLLATLAIGMTYVLRDRFVIVRIDDRALEITHPAAGSERHAWSTIAGYTFWLGVFRVYDRSGAMILRVDNVIDGFPSLLYHVNRHTFRN